MGATKEQQQHDPAPNVAMNEPSWAAWVVIAGLVAIVIVFTVAVLHYDTATQVTTAVGAVSGVIAALVGTYFGIRGTYTAQKIAANTHTASLQHHAAQHHEPPPRHPTQ
jgi:uncharacterized membrane protein YdcZ (DUF606 family)